jgi:hypothetical protein
MAQRGQRGQWGFNLEFWPGVDLGFSWLSRGGVKSVISTNYHWAKKTRGVTGDDVSRWVVQQSTKLSWSDQLIVTGCVVRELVGLCTQQSYKAWLDVTESWWKNCNRWTMRGNDWQTRPQACVAGPLATSRGYRRCSVVVHMARWRIQWVLRSGGVRWQTNRVEVEWLIGGLPMMDRLGEQFARHIADSSGWLADISLEGWTYRGAWKRDWWQQAGQTVSQRQRQDQWWRHRSVAADGVVVLCGVTTHGASSGCRFA